MKKMSNTVFVHRVFDSISQFAKKEDCFMGQEGASTYRDQCAQYNEEKDLSAPSTKRQRA